MTHPVLVLGATGRHGNTGGHLVRRLVEEGHAVRALARSHSMRTEELAEWGAEIVIGDLHDRRSLIPALADVDLAFFTYPIAAGAVPAAANYAAAAREVGRSLRTVVMSMGPAHPENPSALGRAQWLCEEVLQWAGLDLTILRIPALFQQNLLVLHGESIRHDGTFRNSFGNGEIAWISGGDAAELALTALLHPERFDGPIAYPPGSEQFSHSEVADLLTDLLGARIRFESVSREQWHDELLAQSLARPDGPVNAAMAQHISAVGDVVARSGAAVPANTSALETLIGRAPQPLRSFLQENLEAFRPANRRRADTG